MSLKGYYLELQSIEVAFLYAINRSNLIGVFVKFIFLLYISVLKYYSLTLL